MPRRPMHPLELPDLRESQFIPIRCCPVLGSVLLATPRCDTNVPPEIDVLWVQLSTTDRAAAKQSRLAAS
eukprot:770900-Pyramimonas_sp.AAC.1